MSSGAAASSRSAICSKIYRVGEVDVHALRGVDLDVKAGEFLSIIGPSGSGKSTLFHIIGGLTPPTAGTVRVADQDLAAMTDAGRTRMRRRTVGFVFQKFNLLPNLTARDNIAVARYLGGTRFQARSAIRRGAAGCSASQRASITSRTRSPAASSSASPSPAPS